MARMEERILHKSSVFTTEAKVRRLLWHKQIVVRTRAAALQESFFPTTDVRYEAVQKRMASLLGIVDRASVLAYLGRPKHKTIERMDQTVQYVNRGTTVPKKHTFTRELRGKKGYIETFSLGYVYVERGQWFIHWQHSEQTSLLPSNQGEASQQKASIDYFSLATIAAKQPTAANVVDVANVGINAQEKRERESLCERNCGSESILGQPQASPSTWLTASQKATIEERDRKRVEVDRELLPFLEKAVKNRGETR